MFFHRNPRKGKVIYDQIDEYAFWKSGLHPMIAGSRKALLYRMADSFKLNSVTELSEYHIAYFVGEQMTQFYSEAALKAIRELLWYCRMAGYNCMSYRMATEKQARKAGRPVQWDMVKRVKELREKGHSDHTIAQLLKAALGRRVHKTSVERWRQRIPELPR